MIEEYLNAQQNFMIYTMRLSYGNQNDIGYNFEMANYWDKILKELYNKPFTNL